MQVIPASSINKHTDKITNYYAYLGNYLGFFEFVLVTDLMFITKADLIEEYPPNLEEKKLTRIPLVAASEHGIVQAFNPSFDGSCGVCSIACTVISTKSDVILCPCHRV